MKKDIAIIIPTKERLDMFCSFADSWVATTEGLSDVIVGIDNNDITYKSIESKYPFIYEYLEPKPFLHILNELAIKYCKTYKYIGFLEDDCTFNTPKWESNFVEKLDTLGKNGIVWGNDLLNKDKLVGLPFMNSSIISRLGFIAPHEIKCLWADYFWKSIVDTCNSGYYFDNIIIEHRHYSTGKVEKDFISEVIEQIGHTDYHNYANYRKTKLLLDLAKLK